MKKTFRRRKQYQAMFVIDFAFYFISFSIFDYFFFFRMWFVMKKVYKKENTWSNFNFAYWKWYLEILRATYHWFKFISILSFQFLFSFLLIILNLFSPMLSTLHSFLLKFFSLNFKEHALFRYLLKIKSLVNAITKWNIYFIISMYIWKSCWKTRIQTNPERHRSSGKLIIIIKHLRKKKKCSYNLFIIAEKLLVFWSRPQVDVDVLYCFLNPHSLFKFHHFMYFYD